MQIKLLELQDLLKQTQHEPRLKGPFPIKLYRSILASLQTILDKLHSMRCVTTREEWYVNPRLGHEFYLTWATMCECRYTVRQNAVVVGMAHRLIDRRFFFLNVERAPRFHHPCKQGTPRDGREHHIILLDVGIGISLESAAATLLTPCGEGEAAACTHLTVFFQVLNAHSIH